MRNEALVYEIKWLLDLIYWESDKLIGKITDTTRFEERCIRDLGNYLALDDNNKNNHRHLKLLVYRKVREAEEVFKKENSIVMSSMIEHDEEGKEKEFEPEDVLADVEGEVIAKEMAVLLAQDDRRKKIIEAWKVGNTNRSSISRTLARTLGGNVESHRKFIQRFEKECREKLSLSEAI